MGLLCKHFAFPLQLSSPSVSHKDHKIYCYTIWGEKCDILGFSDKNNWTAW